MDSLFCKRFLHFVACVCVSCLAAACGGGGSDTPITAALMPAASTGHQIENVSQFSAATAQLAPRYGLSAMTAMDQLPLLQPTVFAGHQSSFDRTGGNNDMSQFLYQDASGNSVMFDQIGPGVIYRIWIASWPGNFDYNEANVTLRIYLDGSSTPAVTATLKDLTHGTLSAWPTPLVSSFRGSSGGWTLYRPISYQSRAIVTVQLGPNVPSTFWYNIDYQRLPPGTAVTSSFSAAEDTTAAVDMWNRARIGTDPNDESQASTVSGNANIAAGSSTTLLDIAGPRALTSVKLQIPGIVANPASAAVTDSGRTHQSSSQFTLSLLPTNHGAILSRRMDYGVGNQAADVYVDGSYAGRWSSPGSDTANRWRDVDFYLPATLTAGKQQVTVQVRFVSSDAAWTEYLYTVKSVTGNGLEASDSLDVGNLASEAAHTNSIGLVIPDLLNSFFVELVHVLEKTAAKDGYFLVLAHADEDPQTEIERIRFVLSRKVAGMVLIPCRDHSHSLKGLQQCLVPVVMADRVDDSFPVSTVTTDSLDAAKAGTRYLLSLGHHRITFVTNTLDYVNSQARAEGYRLAMAEADLTPQVLVCGTSAVETQTLVLDLLRRQSRPTALFTGGNVMTLAALRAIADANLQLPDDLSLLSFDDAPWMSVLKPRISAIRQPVEAIGSAIWQLLLAAIQAKGPVAFSHLNFKAELLPRDSTIPVWAGRGRKRSQ